MPKRTDISTILIIGAGPIVIGQACEFDYSGTQACKALKAEGYRIVLVNSNPATIMTDPDLADATYIEPITPEIVARIIEKERNVVPGGFALLPTMGGQTALNCALSLRRMGTLDKFDVEMIGATADAIDKAEDRALFRDAMTRIGLETPRSKLANASELKRQDRDTLPPAARAHPGARHQRGAEGAGARRVRARMAQAASRSARERYQDQALIEALQALDYVGLPAIIRPSFTLGGTGGGIAYTKAEFLEIVERGLDASPTNEVLIEESVLGWKEFEMEVVRDKRDNCIIICSIENVDPMGVHTGDSITIAPALTLTDKEYQIMRDASIAVLREIGVETGGSNVQFAVNPDDGRLVVIEMNPRVSRSSALASKATGFPIAKVAAKLAVGYTLDEIANDITGGATPASFEPTIDYVVTKIPRFAFEKFPGAEPVLTTSMKSVGEAMAIGRTFQESLQKALRSLETGLTGLDEITIEGLGQGDDKNVDPRRARHADARPAAQGRAGDAARLLRRRHLSRRARSIRGSWRRSAASSRPKARSAARACRKTAGALRRLKAMGFSDARLVGAGEAPRGGRDRGAPRARRAAGVQAHRHLRGRVRLAHRLHVFDLRDAVRRRRRRRGAAFGPEEGRHPRRRAEPHRPGHRVRLLLLPRLLRAERSRLRDHHGQLQSRDGLDRLRHLRPALFRAADAGGRARDHRHRAAERHAARRHRAVRRTDAAQARRGAGEGRRSDPRHVAGRDRPRRGPQPLQAPARSAQAQAAGERHRLFGRAGAADRRRPRLSVRGAPLLRARRPRDADHPRGEPARRLSARHAARAGAARRQGALSERQDRADQHGARQEPAAVRPLSLRRDRGRRRLPRRRQGHLHRRHHGAHRGGRHPLRRLGLLAAAALARAPATIAELERQTRALALALKVGGLMNVQYAIKDGDIYVLEVNPRASRTVPFVAKVIGLPVAKIAARIMAGESLASFALKPPRFDHVGVKEAVFPFARFPGRRHRARPGDEVDRRGDGARPLLRHRVRQEPARRRFQRAAQPEPCSYRCATATSRAFSTPSSCWKSSVSRSIATGGTQRYLSQHGVTAEKVNKVLEGRPHIVDRIKNGGVQLVFNTTDGVTALADSRSLRRAALLHKVPYYTTLSGAVAAAQGIRARLEGDLQVRALQSYFGGKA